MKLTAENLKWYGRTTDIKGVRYFDYSSSAFEFCFTGKKAVCKILSDPENWNDTNKGVLGLYVTEIPSPEEYRGESYWENLGRDIEKKFVLEEKENTLVLFESKVEKTVVIKVIKISEAAFGYAGFVELEIEGKQNLPYKIEKSQKNRKKPLKMEIIGDSITCGYGIEGVFNKDTFTTKQERADKSYAFLTARNLGAEFRCVSWSGIGLISKYVDPSVNVPDLTISMPLLWPYKDKSLALRMKIEPEIQPDDFDPDIVVIHLGTNDASFVRKMEDRRLLYVHSLRVFIESVHAKYPEAKICCCLGVMGQDLCDSVSEAAELFKKDFPKVQIKTVKFPVQLDEDGIAADWHPSAKTHEKVAAQLTEELKNW